MKCIYCGAIDSKVVDSRMNDEGTSIRRRRECLSCGKRFTTHETIETTPIMVVKKTGYRQPYSSEKVKSGIMKACAKRPVASQDIENLVVEIDKKVANNISGEVLSTDIGKYIMDGLKGLDDVAYVRFAAVYREFKDINSWYSEIKGIVKEKKVKK